MAPDGHKKLDEGCFLCYNNTNYVKNKVYIKEYNKQGN